MSFNNARFEGFVDDNGHPIVIVDEVDAEDRALIAVLPQMSNGVFVRDHAQIQDALAAHKALKDYGLTVSSAVTDAIAVMEAVKSYVTHSPVPLIAGMTPEDALAALDAHVRAKAVDAQVPGVLPMFVAQAQAQLERALNAETDSVLSQLRKPFEKAAAEYTKHLDATAYTAPGDAALADTTGAMVGRYHAARLAAQAMNRMADLILALVPRDGGVRNEAAASSGRVPCLVADFEDAGSILSVAHADPKVQRGAIGGDLPFGHYPAILEAGGELGLPTDAEDWRSRIEVYAGARDAAAFGLFR